jgi:hypothetical protein
VGDAVRYVQSRLALMNYADARRHGLPIGSGAVEATCKSLVSVRMKRCGSRWKHQSGNEILQLRALQLSDRWDAAMSRIPGPLRKPVHVVAIATKRSALPPEQPFSSQNRVTWSSVAGRRRKRAISQFYK